MDNLTNSVQYNSTAVSSLSGDVSVFYLGLQASQ